MCVGCSCLVFRVGSLLFGVWCVLANVVCWLMYVVAVDSMCTGCPFFSAVVFFFFFLCVARCVLFEIVCVVCWCVSCAVCVMVLVVCWLSGIVCCCWCLLFAGVDYYYVWLAV